MRGNDDIDAAARQFKQGPDHLLVPLRVEVGLGLVNKINDPLSMIFRSISSAKMPRLITPVESHRQVIGPPAEFVEH